MRLKKTTKRGHGTMHELNITPLLDLVFVLLVIFIITTPQMMNNLEMTLPSPKPPPPSQEKPRINKIAVEASGQITLNDQNVSVAELRSGLQSLKATDPDLKVVTAINRPPPSNFPPVVTIRFDIASEETQPLTIP